MLLLLLLPVAAAAVVVVVVVMSNKAISRMAQGVGSTWRLSVVVAELRV